MFKKAVFLIGLALGILLASGSGLTQASSTIRVPSEQPTIQAAIDAALNGDTILVAPGVYYENILFGAKSVRVTSESGPSATTIDGSSSSTVARFVDDGGFTSELSGFTIQNGLGGNPLPWGGGITIERASPSILGNRIVNNKGSDGGGIRVLAGSPTIQDNIISGNNAASGGGISAGAGAARILDNMISSNRAASSGGGIALNAAQHIIVRGQSHRRQHC